MRTNRILDGLVSRLPSTVVANITDFAQYSPTLARVVVAFNAKADPDKLARAVKTLKVKSAQQEADAWYAIRTHEMAALRTACDALEELVADSAWPMPGYSDLLYDL